MYDQNFKRGRDVRKREDQISKGSLFFFFFINQNFCHILTFFLLFRKTGYRNKEDAGIGVFWLHGATKRLLYQQVKIPGQF